MVGARETHTRPSPRVATQSHDSPHRRHPFTRFLESGLGVRLARLTRGRDRSRSWLAPQTRGPPAMTHALPKGVPGGSATRRGFTAPPRPCRAAARRRPRNPESRFRLPTSGFGGKLSWFECLECPQFLGFGTTF